MRATRSRSVRSATVAGPSKSALLRVIDRAGFADHGHLDLTGVLELVLDAARDVLGEPHRFLVGDLLALDHDPDFAAGLQRERLRDALEGIRDPLELFQPFDVRLEDVAPRA